MTVLLGTKQGSTIFTHTVGQDELLQTGITYEAVYPVEGVGTFFPGWENDAINTVTSTLATHECTPTYLEVNGDLFSPHSLTVQFQYTPTGAQAVVAPFVVLVVLLLVGVVIVWIMINAPSTIKAISDSLVENPVVMYLGGGILALLLLRELREWRGSGYDD